MRLADGDVVTTYPIAGRTCGGILEAEGQELGGKEPMFLKRLERRKNGK